ncbi:MAG: hypothetical protein AB7N91_05070 [Candidatus Tectimicrobiota bacterium]
MAVIMHRNPQLQKCLSKLRKAGGRGALAAERVETIIATLTRHTGLRPDEVHKLTRHGEARIEHCKKFDLVGGYRLVYVKEGPHYYFLYAGTHDDCDRWLTNNRSLKLDPPATPLPRVERSTAETGAVTAAPEAMAGELDYDEIVLKDLDEKMLRRIFRGLCET